MSDFKELEIGMIMDVIFTFVNSMGESDKEKQKVRNATQADFDRF